MKSKIKQISKLTLALGLMTAMTIPSFGISAYANNGSVAIDSGFQNPWQVGFDESMTEIERIDYVDANGNALMRSGLIEHEEKSGMFLTNKVTYIDEYGDIVVMRYFTDAEGLRQSSSRAVVSGTKTHMVEATHNWNTATQTRWVSGTFTYDSEKNTVSVSDQSGGVNNVSGITVSNRSTEVNYGSTLILGLGRRWGEVSYTFDTKNSIGNTRSFSVRARVNSQGNS